MRIGLVYNLRPADIKRTDPKLEEFIDGDEWSTVKGIGDAIQANGHRVSYLPSSPSLYHDLEKVKNRLDLIFNYCEWIVRGADREAQLPMVCELLGLPYTGPGPLSSALILNKSRAKEIWQSYKLATPVSQTVYEEYEKLSSKLEFPLIVKPNGEGSGIGIKNYSLVNNPSQLKKAITLILKEYQQPALVETYLPGREFTVGIIGNGNNLTVLPIIEINFAAFPKGVPAIDTYEAKFIYGATGEVPMHETEFCPAKLTKSLEGQVVRLAKSAYQAIGCRDYGRLDIRLDSKGKPSVLEINHPVGLMSDPEESSFFTIAARAYGWDFTKTIGKILEATTTRLRF